MHDKTLGPVIDDKRFTEMIHPIFPPADPRTTDPGCRPLVSQQRRIDRQILPNQLCREQTYQTAQNDDYF
jgi:hypothetical protein